MEIKQILAYETTDGRLFTQQGAAVAHQKDLDLRAAVQSFVDSHCYSGMGSVDVFDMLYENRDELRRIFG